MSEAPEAIVLREEEESEEDKDLFCRCNVESPWEAVDALMVR